MTRLSLEVGAGEAGHTLQAFLREHGGLSHARARGLIDAGAVRALGGAPVRPGDYARRLQAGERYEVVFDPGRRYRPQPRERPGRGYRVAHRDDDLLVVDKEPEVLSVPTALRAEESLVDRLLLAERARGVRAPVVLPVHRLDRDTSGLILYARTRAAREILRTRFAERAVTRGYLAVCEGRLAADRGRFESRVVEDPRSLKMRSTTRPGEGRDAITEFRVTERLAGATVVTVRLETGRKNQIRVHFAEAGHPLVGDGRYGRRSPLIGRTALHARSLSFAHPRSGARMAFQSPLPADLRELLRLLRRRGA